MTHYIIMFLLTNSIQYIKALSHFCTLEFRKETARSFHWISHKLHVIHIEWVFFANKNSEKSKFFWSKTCADWSTWMPRANNHGILCSWTYCQRVFELLTSMNETDTSHISVSFSHRVITLSLPFIAIQFFYDISSPNFSWSETFRFYST